MLRGVKPLDIIIKLDKEDSFQLAGIHEVFNIEDPRDFKYTFWNKQLNRLPRFPSPQAIDLLMISFAVYKADRVFERKDADNSWERTFHLHVPVLKKDLFESNKELLRETVSFLTGDRWDFSFRGRELTSKEITLRCRMNQLKLFKKDENKICMLSGGLDSFIGAIDLLEGDERDISFVSIYGGGKGARSYQDLLKGELSRKYLIPEGSFYSFYAASTRGVEGTTRSRSFMFYSHAIAIATCFNRNIKLVVPENGFIALNIPLTYSRIGTSSTRTTHPHYMKLFQKLLDALGITVSFSNPYRFKTKGEMISECRNSEFLSRNIVNTMSCSHPDSGRMRKEDRTRHCGTCYPCLIRRAAINKAGINDKTKYYDPNFVLGKTAQTNLNSYLLGLEKHEPKKAFLSVQMSGPIDSNITQYESMYKRGIEELKEILEDY